MPTANLALTADEWMSRYLDPTLLLGDADFPPPHPAQTAALRNWRNDHMLLWTRQGGKSTTGAALACHNLVFPMPGHRSTVVIVSRAERQSGELFRKTQEFYHALPYAPPLAKDSATVMETTDGGRVLAYPGNEETVRGLSAVTLALVDEATLLPRELFDAVSPMLATTGGPIWSMATAKGCAGWFYEDWRSTTNNDLVVKSKVTWRDLPHINRDHIEREKRRMPPWMFAQEYECEFIDDGETQLITPAMIDAARNPEVVSLW
ncbi:MAG: terminase family protein [Planctomycetota bacterium]